MPTGKIRKISSGGYVTAAITVGNDLYAWGGKPNEPKLLDKLEAYPEAVDVEGFDVLDVAVGDNHMLALTTDNRLFVIGLGGNGQLGLGAPEEFLKSWKEVVLPLDKNRKMVKVYAGYKTSFVLVE